MLELITNERNIRVAKQLLEDKFEDFLRENIEEIALSNIYDCEIEHFGNSDIIEVTFELFGLAVMSFYIHSESGRIDITDWDGNSFFSSDKLGSEEMKEFICKSIITTILECST